MGQDNNSLPKNVHDTMSGTLGQWIRKETKCMHLSTQTHTQNMGQDNNPLSENVHNTRSRTLGQWIGKEKKYLHFQHKHILKSKTTTHHLRMYIMQ